MVYLYENLCYYLNYTYKYSKGLVTDLARIFAGYGEK